MAHRITITQIPAYVLQWSVSPFATALCEKWPVDNKTRTIREQATECESAARVWFAIGKMIRIHFLKLYNVAVCLECGLFSVQISPFFVVFLICFVLKAGCFLFCDELFFTRNQFLELPFLGSLNWFNDWENVSSEIADIWNDSPDVCRQRQSNRVFGSTHWIRIWRLCPK